MRFDTPLFVVCPCVIFLLMFAPPLMAQDVVVMKNGDRITGEVKKIWDGEVFIEPEYGDEYAIDMKYVAHVETAEPFDVEVRIGRRIEAVEARLGLDESQDAAVINAEGMPLYPLSMVDNVSEIEDYFDWKIRSDLSINISEGNSDTSSNRLNVYGELKIGDHRHEVELTRDEQRTNDELTKDQTNVNYQDTWTFTDDWFLRGSVDWTSDPIRDLDHRTRVFLGPGYHVFDDSLRRLNFSLGPEYVIENIGGDSDESLAIKIAADYDQQFFNGDLEVFQTTDYTRIFEGRENKLFGLTVGFRYELTDDFYLSWQVTYDYESNPAENQKNEDYTYLMGVGLELD